jgi:hypothetical protein
MPMVWATRSADGAASHISEVIHGLGCECVCPGCLAQLEAVNSENPYWKKRPHFRHYNSPELSDCEPKAVLKAAKETLSRASQFLLPEAIVSATVKSKSGKIFTQEKIIPSELQEITSYDFVDTTDAILTLSSGQQIYVRLVASGKIESKDAPKQTKFAEVLIDISDPVLKTADRETLRRHITLSPEQRKWCSNQIDSRLHNDLLIAAQREADEYDEKWLLLQQPRIIPNGDPADPRTKLRMLREAFRLKQLQLDQSNTQELDEPKMEEEDKPLPTWSSLKKKNTSFHAFKLRDDESCWVLINSALHDGYFIAPSPSVFDGWDEVLPPSLGRPDYEHNAYIGSGNMQHVDQWFYGSKRLAGSNIDSDPRLILKFVDMQMRNSSAR